MSSIIRYITSFFYAKTKTEEPDVSFVIIEPETGQSQTLIEFLKTTPRPQHLHYRKKYQNVNDSDSNSEYEPDEKILKRKTYFQKKKKQITKKR